MCPLFIITVWEYRHWTLLIRYRQPAPRVPPESKSKSTSVIRFVTRRHYRVSMADSLDPRLKGYDFSTIPITVPPPGVISNFDNPQTIAPAILAIGVVMVILTVSFVALRMYSNHHASRKYGIDDCMMRCNARGCARSWMLTAGRYVYHGNTAIRGRHRHRYQL